MKLLHRILPIALAGVALTLLAQTGRKAPDPGPNGEQTASGPVMFSIFCASCHGIDGKGAGPVAGALKTAVPDLTTITRRNGGAFPEFRITHIIDGYEVIAAHGSREMPVWGDMLPQNREDALVKLREHNLTEYLRSIQK